ncbi:MAG TPA: hypothetical protein VFA34_06405 [Actinomycetota bacterium]|jgi:hypothetical protein|nr:hypothetical protein [Actinomycetota bacterium]
MSKVIVTVICSAAIAGALAIVVRWGRLDSSFRAEEPGIASAVRRLCVLEVSGIIAGALVGGLGSRLMMRIMAATSGAAAQGRVTEADEIVGRVTQEGTVGLLLFVGIGFGLVGAMMLAVVGRFLFRRAWLGGMVLGILALGIFARTDPLSPDNSDFTILSPVALAVGMICALFVLYGMTVVSLSARLERSFPRLEWKARSLVAYIPLLLLAFPPFPLAVLGAIGIGALCSQAPRLADAWRSPAVQAIGSVVVALAAIGANIWLGFGIAEILS